MRAPRHPAVENLLSRIYSDMDSDDRRALGWAASKLDELLAERRWIPVGERLPELRSTRPWGDEMDVLCYGSGPAGKRVYSVTFHYVPTPDFDYETGKPCWEVLAQEYAEVEDVTHWMPMPQIPEEES